MTAKCLVLSILSLLFVSQIDAEYVRKINKIPKFSNFISFSTAATTGKLSALHRINPFKSQHAEQCPFHETLPGQLLMGMSFEQ